MEKAPPAPPPCPVCKGPAHFGRPVNDRVEFWECEGEGKHMFVVDKAPPPRTPAVAAPAAASGPVES